MTDAQNMSAGSSDDAETRDADLSGLLGFLSGKAESTESSASEPAPESSPNLQASSARDLESNAPARSQSSPPNQAPSSSGGSLLEQLGYASEDVPASPNPSPPAKSVEESAAERKAAEDFLQGLGLGGGSSGSADDEVGQLQELLVSPTIVALRERISVIEEKIIEIDARQYDPSELMKNMVAVFAELLKRQLVEVKQEISIELKQVIFAEFKQVIFADFKQDIMDSMAPLMERLAEEMDSREKNLSIRVVGISKDAS